MERGEAMGVRVVRTAAEQGLPPPELRRLERIHAVAMELRDRLVADDHAPDYLHPGRSALILLQDLAETDGATLAAALVLDSETPALAPGPGAIDDAEIVALRDEVPLPGAEDLAERLVVADDRVRRIALAERLDHLRHAHLWPDRRARHRVHEEALRVYEPVAARTHPVLARRYAWWCRMFGARHLG